MLYIKNQLYILLGFTCTPRMDSCGVLPPSFWITASRQVPCYRCPGTCPTWIRHPDGVTRLAPNHLYRDGAITYPHDCLGYKRDSTTQSSGDYYNPLKKIPVNQPAQP